MSRLANVDEQSANMGEHTEGRVARVIEQQTSKLPSDFFLWGAIGCIAAAFTLHFIMGRKEDGLYVGEWVPTLLILGTYNKLVKQHGHHKGGEHGIG